MEQFLSVSIVGLVLGAVYAVASSGLVVTYTTSGVFNLAHGAIGMLGAFAYWQLTVEWGWPRPVAVALILLVLAPALGVAIERWLMRALEGVSEVTTLVVTIGLLATFISLGQIVWPQDTGRSVTPFFGANTVEVGGVYVSWHDLLILGVAIFVALALRFLLYGTRLGISMRAVVDDRPLAQLCGAQPNKAAAASWGLGCSLAALSGILLADRLGLNVFALTLLVVNAYAAAVVGRLVSLPMTFLGAMILGLLASWAVRYQDTIFDFLRLRDKATGNLKGGIQIVDLGSAIPVLLLFIVLLLIPQARLRGHSAVRGRERVPRPDLGRSLTGFAALLAVAGVAAVLFGDAEVELACKAFGMAIVMLSLVPLTGYGGQISLAQIAFAGIGAVAMSKFGGEGGSPFGLVAAAAMAGAVGAIVALPALRLQGIYLALSTMAFAVFMEKIVFTQEKVFELGSIDVPRPGLGPLGLDSDRAYLVFMAAMFSLVGLVVVVVRRGPFGRRLQAMKDSPAACATLGIDLTRTKLAVFVLSAAIAGVGGALAAGVSGTTNREEYNMLLVLPILLMAVGGGIAMVSGALFGGLVYGSFPWLSEHFPFLENLLLLTPGLVGINLGQNPDGAVSIISRRVGAFRARGAPAAEEPSLAAAASAALPRYIDDPESIPIGGPLTPIQVAVLDHALGVDRSMCVHTTPAPTGAPA